MKDPLMKEADSPSEIIDEEIEEKDPVYVFNVIRLNPGVTKLNFVCGLLFSLITLFGTGGVSGLQLLILLDPKYYNIPQSNAGSVNSLVLVISSSVAIITGVPYGHLADTLGRRMIVTIGAFSFLLGCLLMPLQTSVFPGFIMAFILITNASTAFSSLPLIADYVAEESRGKAFAFVAVIICFAALIPNLFTKYLLYSEVPLGVCYYIFGISAFVGLLINNLGLRKGIYKSKKQDEAQTTPQGSFLKRMIDAYQIFKSNNWLKISLVLQALAASDFSVFMSFLAVYVKSFFPDGSTEGNTLVNNLQTILILTMIVSMPLTGILLDKTKKMIPICLISLCGGVIALVLFSISTKPSDITLFVGAFLFGSTLPGLATVINLINFKHYPAEKRGLMIGFAHLITNSSYFVFAVGGGFLYDKWRKNGPFMVCAGLLGLTILLVFLISRKIRKEEETTEVSPPGSVVTEENSA